MDVVIVVTINVAYQDHDSQAVQRTSDLPLPPLGSALQSSFFRLPTPIFSHMIQRRDIRAIRCLDFAVFQLGNLTDEEIVTTELLRSPSQSVT